MPSPRSPTLTRIRRPTRTCAVRLPTRPHHTSVPRNGSSVTKLQRGWYTCGAAVQCSQGARTHRRRAPRPTHRARSRHALPTLAYGGTAASGRQHGAAGGGTATGTHAQDVDAPPPPVCGSADGHGAAAHAPSREHARRDRLDRYGGARRQRDLAADVDISPPRSLPLEAPFLLARVDVGQHGRLLGPLGDCRVGGGGGLLLVRRVELARLELLPVVIL